MTLGTAALPAAGSNATPAAPSPERSGAPASALARTAAPSKQNAAPSQPPPSAEAARQAAAQINAFLKTSSAASVEFTVDGKSDQVIVRIVDTATNQLIRQIPSEQALAISQALDGISGMLLRQKA